MAIPAGVSRPEQWHLDLDAAIDQALRRAQALVVSQAAGSMWNGDTDASPVRLLAIARAARNILDNFLDTLAFLQTLEDRADGDPGRLTPQELRDWNSTHTDTSSQVLMVQELLPVFDVVDDRPHEPLVIIGYAIRPK